MGYLEEEDEDLAADGEMPAADPSDPLKGKLYPYLRERAKRQKLLDQDRATLADESTRSNQGALLAALSKGSSMMGSLGGKMADSSIVPEMNKQLGGQFQEDFAAEQGLRKNEDAARRFEEDQYTKRQALYDKLKQKKAKTFKESSFEVNGNPLLLDSEGNYSEGKVPAGTRRPVRPHMGGTPQVQEYTNEAGDVLAGQKVGGRVIKSEGDTVLKPAVASSNKNLSDAAGKADQIANYLETQLQIYDSKKDPKEKIILGRGLLKGLNSAFGPDAIGVDEAKRLGGDLEYTFDLAGKGLDPSPNIASFRQKIVDQIQAQRAASTMNRQTSKGTRPASAPANVGGAPPTPQKSVDEMTDEEVDAAFRARGLGK